MTPVPQSLVRALSQWLCAFLLFAQQAALTHVVSHASAAPAAHEQQESGKGGQNSDAPGLVGLCAFDAAFGQVLSGGPATQHARCFGTAVAQSAVHCSRACTTADTVTPRSRGPP